MSRSFRSSRSSAKARTTTGAWMAPSVIRAKSTSTQPRGKKKIQIKIRQSSSRSRLFLRQNNWIKRILLCSRVLLLTITNINKRNHPEHIVWQQPYQWISVFTSHSPFFFRKIFINRKLLQNYFLTKLHFVESCLSVDIKVFYRFKLGTANSEGFFKA